VIPHPSRYGSARWESNINSTVRFDHTRELTPAHPSRSVLPNDTAHAASASHWNQFSSAMLSNSSGAPSRPPLNLSSSPCINLRRADWTTRGPTCSSAKNKFRPGPPNYAPAATQTRAVALAVASPIIFVCLMCFQFQFQISVKKVNSRFDWTSWQIFLKGTWSLQNYKGKFWYIPLINCCLFVIPLPCMDLLVNGHSNNFNLYTQKFHNSSKFILFRTRIVVLSKRMV
jgi:hypothetical protein